MKATKGQLRGSRKDCPRCDWRYWQEPQPTEGGKVIMVWRQQGKPCDDCYDAALERIANVCADGRCTAGRSCEKHSYLYDTPPCGGCGHYHNRKTDACTDRKCSCEATVEWDFNYPEPESVTSREEGGRASITAYHRGNQAAAERRAAKRRAAKAREQAEAEARRKAMQDDDICIVPLTGPEAERYWKNLNYRLGKLMQPESLTQMARRILTKQREQGKRAGAYGEGMYGIVALDVDAEGKLADLEREAQIAALEKEQQQDAHDPSNLDALAPDEEADYDTPGEDDGGFDLGAYLEAC